MNVPDLFTLAPFSDMNTSRVAAKSMLPHLARLESRVLDVLVIRGPKCAFELESILKMPGNTLRPRLVALCARGFVVKTTRTKRTLSGRAAAVYEAVEARMPKGAEWPR